MARNTEALEVWLKFDTPEDEETTAEALVWEDGGQFRVDWDLTAVGLVTSVYFNTHEEARTWLEREGFEDYTAEDDD